MRIGVLDKHQARSESPIRHISKKRAEKFITRDMAKWIVAGKILQMVKSAEELRQDAKFFQPNLPWIPRLRAPRGPENLVLSYPHRDQNSAPRPFGCGQSLRSAGALA